MSHGLSTLLQAPESCCGHAAAVSIIAIHRRQRADVKAGTEAGQSRHWGQNGPKQARPDPRGFLASPKSHAEFFGNPLQLGTGEKSAGLFSIREDAQEVQRNASNHSNTSRDALLPGSQAGLGEGSPPYAGGAVAV